MAASMPEASSVDLLHDSKLFDASWYLHRYPDVADAGVDPVKHYLNYGWREGRRPYPLLTTPPAWWRFKRFVQASDVSVSGFYSRASLQSNPVVGVTVIVPVFNAPQEVARCLTALVRHLPQNVEVLVIDDASTDPAIAGLLEEFGACCGITVVRHSVNMGFTKTVNEGIRLAGENDVVLLNSDTQVGPGWLTRLRYTAYKDEFTASVTALSNNAGAFSAGSVEASSLCESPEDFELLARAVAQSGKTDRIQVPTGNGFCIYLRHACIEQVGVFDELAFPRGYGEENDWCQRAEQSGWHHLIDASVYVYHARNASFGIEKQGLLANAEQVINERYPEYRAKVSMAFAAPALQGAQQRVGDVASNTALVRSALPAVMTVIAGGDDSLATYEAKSLGIAQDFQSFQLVLDQRRMNMYWIGSTKKETVRVATHSFDIAEGKDPHLGDEFAEVLANWLILGAIELVHIAEMKAFTPKLTSVCRHLMIPVFSG